MRNFVLTLLLLLPSLAVADSVKPTELAKIIHANTPFGQGSLSRLWITAYDAVLWLDGDAWSMKAPFALSLHYHMTFSTDELVERTIEEMQRIPNIDAAAIESYKKQLPTLFPTVHDGDIITAVYQPHKGTRFYYNHSLTGQIKDESFADHFFAIWLGPNTSEPGMRSTLLQLK